jgi:hypothetical protein
MERGHAAALTVDGPKGPPRAVQEGIVTLARRSQAWILPVAAGATRPRFLRSWDRYLVPKPFSRNFVVYGEPFRLAHETNESALRRIKESIDAATAEADRRAESIARAVVNGAPRSPAGETSVVGMRRAGGSPRPASGCRSPREDRDLPARGRRRCVRPPLRG